MNCEYCNTREATMYSDQGRAQCDTCAPPGVSSGPDLSAWHRLRETAENTEESDQ